ncbi:MAG TPA: hypothetical protein VF945_06605 [Polyangia bacterium]
MRSVVLVLAIFSLAVAGCLGVDTPDGSLKCADVPQRACPEGFYCYAQDNTCWRFGHFPDLGIVTPPRLPPETDMSMPVPDDMTGGLDGGGDDLLQTD